MDTCVVCPMSRDQKTTIKSQFYDSFMVNMEENSHPHAWEQVPSPA